MWTACSAGCKGHRSDRNQCHSFLREFSPSSATDWIHGEQRTPQDEDELHAELRKGHFFRDLNISPDAEIEFCKCLVLQTEDKTGTKIEQEGEDGHKCYVVLSGSVSVETEDAGRIKTLKSSDAFGVHVLRDHSKYPASYVALDVPLLLLTVSKYAYEMRIGPCEARDQETKERQYRSISVFMDWSSESLRHLCDETHIKRFNVGQKLAVEGQFNFRNELMFIIRGFCEVSKMVDGHSRAFGTLTLGDTVGLEHHLREEALSFTATAGAIVEVMTIEMSKLMQPRDGPKLDGFVPLLDEKTLQKLLEREKKPPSTQDHLQKVTVNEKSWDQYKKQLVSGLVWDVRYKKFTSGGNFSKYVKMDMVARHDLAQEEAPGDHHSTLTSHISPAVLPPSVQSTVGKHEHFVLDKVLVGQWMTDAHECDILLNEKYYRRGRSPSSRASSPQSHKSPQSPQRPQKPFQDWGLPNSKTRIFLESNPVRSTSGLITPSYEALQCRWQQIRGLEYRREAAHDRSKREPATQKHKHDCRSGPRELERRPPSSAFRRSKKHIKPEDSSETSASALEPWRPAGYHRGGILPKGSPFASPSYPIPDWSLQGERWILKPKEEVSQEKTPTGRWVPGGVHKITSQMSWSEETSRFERVPVRQWSALDPSEEAIYLGYDGGRPSTAPQGDASSSLDSSMSLSKVFGSRYRPRSAVTHARPWSPGGALLPGDAFSAPNSKYAFQTKW